MNYDYCSGKIHTIQTGDTLYKISGMYRVPLALILRANPYVDIYNLQVGEKLCIPGGFDNEIKPPRPPRPPRPGCINPPGCGNDTDDDIDNGVDMEPGGDNNNQQKPGITGVSVFLYVIKDVQSVQNILDKFGITLEDLLKENNLDNIMIQPGTAMKIPGDEDAMRRIIEETEN